MYVIINMKGGGKLMGSDIKVLETIRKTKTPYTQREFAKKMKVTFEHYCRVVNGKTKLTNSFLAKFCKVAKFDFNNLSHLLEN